MRRLQPFSFTVAVAAAMVIAACSDQPRPTAPPNESPLLSQQYSDKKCQLELQKLAADLQKGKDPGRNQGQSKKLQKLIECSGGTFPPGLDGNPDILVGVSNPSDPDMTFVSGNGDYQAQIPHGFFSVPVVIVGARQPDGVQITSFEEFLVKTAITTTPPGMECSKHTTLPQCIPLPPRATVKICEYYGPGEGYGQHLSTGFTFETAIVEKHDLGGVEEVLDVTRAGDDVPYCFGPNGNAPINQFASAGFGPPTGYASRTLAASIRALRGAGAFATRFFLPSALSAATMFVDGGVGGFTDDFGSFFVPVFCSGCGEGGGGGAGPFGPLTTRPSDPASGRGTGRPLPDRKK